MMSLKEILELLYKVHLQEQTSHPFIVGGAARDKIIGNLKKSFNDIDITTGDDTVFHLAKEFGIKLKSYTPLLSKQAIDGHISLYLSNLKIDFSSNFRVPGIEKELVKKGIINPSNMQKEIYSRDFFCNTLLMSLDFRKIKDITGEGIKDIKNKKIRTCLDPELTFKYNVNRIIRVVYLATKLEFEIDPSIIFWIKNNTKYMELISKEYITKNINKSLEFDPDRTAYLINQMNMWDYITINQDLYKYYSKYKR